MFLAAILLAQIATGAMALPPTRVLPSDGTSNGITVTGSATVSAPAASATLTLRVVAKNNAMTITSATLLPLVETLVRAGVDRQSIVLPFYLQGAVHSNNAEIIGKVSHPTATPLKSGVEQITVALAGTPDLTLSNVDVRVQAGNCESISQQVQALALRAARSNAEYLAKQLHVRVGPIQSVQAYVAIADPLFACTTSYTFGMYTGIPASDAQSLFNVRVYSAVTARYAIRP